MARDHAARKESANTKKVRSSTGARSLAWRPRLEQLEGREVPAAIPTAILSGIPPEVLLGQTGTFTVTFDNTSPTDVGYGPYIDLYFPATGADGAGSEVDDGIKFVSATYLGTAVRATVITLTDAGVAHPFAKTASGQPQIITPPAGFRAGDQLVVLEVPFGSFTATQPPAAIQVTAAMSNLADVGTPLTIQAVAGFRFGNDALDNPTSGDPSIVSPPTSTSITPTLFRLTKTYIGPEDETATGPNYVRQYQISVDVATGQKITNLDLTDMLPPELQFVAVTSTSGGTVSSISTPSTTAPGGVLTRRFASVTGTASTTDAQMTFSFYVPRVEAPPLPPLPPLTSIIPPTTGIATTAVDDARADGFWKPLDTRDGPSVPVMSDVTANDHTLTLRSIATQKTSRIVTDTGATGLSPGDTIEYTIDFQVSDYFAFQNLLLTDIFSDGQLYVNGSATLRVTDGHGVGGTTTDVFALGNVALSENFTGGSDQIVFDISQELDDRNFSTDGRLVGGAIPTGGSGVLPPQSNPPLPFGPTQGRITFRTVVQDRYEIDFPSGEPALNPGDPISNSVTISGELLSASDLTPIAGAPPVEDDSSVVNRVQSGTFTKTVYAINGVLNSSNTPGVSPGDRVTYRLRVTLPTADVENFSISDFLPLPIFDVDATGAVTGFDSVVSAAVPAVGRAKFGPTDTFRARTGITPTVTLDSSANSVVFDYGTFSDTTNRPVTVDILFTVQVSNDPFADRLLLSNGAQATSNNTVLDTTSSDSIAQVVLQEPSLKITKGVVATNNPSRVFTPGAVGPVGFNAPGTAGARFTGTISSAGLAARPINSNLSNIDQSDLVTFAIVIENTGSSPKGAFDVRIMDTFPEGFAATGFGAYGINLRVTNGAGTPIAFTPMGDGVLSSVGGIQLVDPSASVGAIRAGIVNGAAVQNGSNIVIITYDLRAVSNTTNQVITNVATLTNYAGSEGGADFTVTDLTDDAKVQIATPKVTKELLRTEITNSTNASNEAVIGELVTYRVRITVPEGRTPSAILTDTLDQELAFVGMVSSNVPASVLLPGSLTPIITNDGRTVTWNLGDIVNNNANNAVTEVIEFVYTAVVVNTAESNANDLVNNGVSFSYAGGNPVQAAAPNVTIIEPQVKITKTSPFATTGREANTPISYTVTLSNTPGANQFTADAFEVSFRDQLPADGGGAFIVSPGFTVVDSAGIVRAMDFELVGDAASGFTLQTIAGREFDLLVNPTRTIRITITGTVSTTVTPGQILTNVGETRWSSLNGDFATTPRSPFTTDSVERTGADGPGGVNDYVASSRVDVPIFNPLIFKQMIATSETATTDPSRVVVGEIVRYRVVVAVPQGTSNSFQITDRLPPGLQFVNDGTARIAFVEDAINPTSVFTSSTITSGTGLYQSGDETNVTTINPVFQVPGTTILEGTPNGTFDPGEDVFFDLGMVQNLDTDPDVEFIVIEYNALVVNVATNQQDVSLINDVAVLINSVQAGGQASAAVVVSEPTITNLSKQLIRPVTGPFQPDLASHDAGDRVRYSAAYSNAVGSNVSTAYNVRLLDALPTAKMTLVPGSVVVYRNGVRLTSGFSIDSSVANTMDVTLDIVAPGDVITTTYDAILTSGVVAGESVQNTANITYTSLPGLRGTASNPTGSQVAVGSSGLVSGERTGTGAAVNDYSDTASAMLNITAPEVDKNILSTNIVRTGTSQFDPNRKDLTIGETVTYRITITAPEGTSTLNLSDLLPTMNTGTVVFQSAHVAGIGANITGSSLAVGSPGVLSGSTITFDFGTVVNTPDNVVNDKDRIAIDVVGQVTDLPENVSSRTVVNTATLDYVFGTTSDSAMADIVEPALDIQKSVSTPQADAGDVVTYTVIVSHLPTSTAPAALLTINDVLNPGNLELVVGSVTVSRPGFIVTDGNTAGDTTVGVTGFVLELGQSLTITYRARLVTTLLPEAVIPNTATLDYSSYIVALGGRPYSDSDPAEVTVNTNSIAGAVYVDLNNNGVFESGGGETGINGVTMQLTGIDHLGNAVSLTTTTQTIGILDGQYLFDDLRPSNAAGYTITEVNQPASFADGRDTVGTLFGGIGTLGATPRDADAITRIVIPTGSNANAVNYNFGELPPATIGDFVWEDLNADGIQDPSESGLNGLTVTLTGTNPDGTTFTLTTTTANNGTNDGAYSFGNLRPGTYTIQFTTPTGYIYTLADVGANDAVDSDASRATGRATITVGIGETNNTIDAGMYRGISLGGFVYRDFNLDGQRQLLTLNPETGIAGVRVILTGIDNGGNVVAPQTITTTASGAYLFTGLSAGSYNIREVQPPSVFTAGFNGFYDAFDTPGTIGGTTQGVSPAKNQLAVTLGVGDDGIDYDFGEIPPADPFGFVYADLNNNGIREVGEPGIQGVRVTVSGIAFAGTPLARPLTAADIPGGRLVSVTNANGRWEFPIMPPGVYSFVETQPVGLLDGLEENADPTSPLSPPVIVGNDRFDNVVLNPFPIRGPFNFGEIATNGSISGSVYVDRNNNGVRDAGEVGIAGVVIQLTGVDLTGRVATATVVTDANGGFSFRRMTPGTYRLTERQPAAYLDGRERAGTAGGAAGNDFINTITLAPNQAATGYLFGELGLRSGMITKRGFLTSSGILIPPATPGSGVANVQYT